MIIFENIFLSSSQRSLLATGTGLLCYHYLGKPPKKTNDRFLFHRPKVMHNQLRALYDAGYEVVPMTTRVTGCMKIVITIDDGAANFHEHGLKILQASRCKAIQYIVSGHIGGLNEWDTQNGHPPIRLMDDVQIREWLAEGHQIGSHTMNHRNLVNLGDADARKQILDSKKQLEDRFGVPVMHFSYPHGKLNERIKFLVSEAGYSTAVTTKNGIWRNETDQFDIPRIQPLSSYSIGAKCLDRMVKRFL